MSFVPSRLVDRTRPVLAALLGLSWLTACGGGGGSSPPNQSPLADAGADQTVVEGSAVTLSAAASSAPDGTIRRYEWRQTAGATITLNAAEAANADFVAPLTDVVEMLEFEVSVTDDDGASATASTTVTVNPNEPPSVTIEFPCNGCRFFDQTISVQGVSNAGTDNEFVAGLDAVTAVAVDAGAGPVLVVPQSDGRWTAQNVPVPAGVTNFRISAVATDSFAEESTARVDLEFGPTFTWTRLALDRSTQDLAYFYEAPGVADRLVEVNLRTRGSRLIYEQTDEAALLPEASSLLIDPAGTRVLLATSSDGVHAIDLASGATSEVSTAAVGSGPLPDSLNLAAVDFAGNRIVAYADDLDALLSIDIATGDRTVIVDNVTPDTGPLFVRPTGLALDETNAIAYLREGDLDTFVAVDLTTGSRTTLPQEAPGFDVDIRGALFDPSRSVVAVVEDLSDTVSTINVTNGDRTVLSPSPPEVELRTGSAKELLLDPFADRYIVNDMSTGSAIDSDQILAIDPDSGSRSLVFSDGIGGGPSLKRPQRFSTSSDGTLAYAVSQAEPDPEIISVDLSSGERTLVSGPSRGDGPDFGDFIASVATDTIGGQLLVIVREVSPVNPRIISVNPVDGNRSIVSGGLVGNGPELQFPAALAVDSQSATAYVVDTTLDAVFAINLDTGDRSILSDGALETIELRNPGSIALDPDRSQLLVAENNIGTTPFIALVGVDLATGARRIVSETTPDLPFLSGVDVVEGGSLAVVSSDRYLFLIDLSDGSRSVLAGADVGNGDWPFGIGDVVYDPRRRVVYGWSSYSEALIEFSMETGDRVVRSK